MRHKVATKLFDRTANQRKALFRGLISSLIEHERIETTVVKAKVIRSMAEKIVTLGKKGDLNSRRLAFSKIPNKKIIKKLFDDIAPRFTDRNGGYLRIIKSRSRIKDNAPLAVLEFVDYESRNAPGKQSEKKEKAEAKTPKAEKKSKEKTPEKEETPKKKTAAAKKTAKTTAKKSATKKKAVKKASE